MTKEPQTTFATTLEVPVERILRGALKKKLRSVIVLGYNDSNNLFIASSTGDAPEIIYALEEAKLHTMAVAVHKPYPPEDNS